MITVLTQRFLKFGTIQLTKGRKRILGKNLPPPNIYYFAYGANLDPQRFERYHMNVTPIGVASLEGYRLTFSLPCEYVGKGYASIEPSEGKKVWGFLYQLDRLALTLLDIMEYAFLSHYRRISVSVKTRDGQQHQAKAYITGFPTEGLVPSTQYKKMILNAAKKHDFPTDYISDIESFQSRDAFDLDPGFSLAIPSRRRPFEKLLKKPYLFHDRLREIMCEKLRF